MTDYILRAEHVSKSFPGVRALDDVQLHVEKGKVHALMGENGAGKSTLMKILIGMYEPDLGDIYFKGKRVAFKGVHAALKAGLSMIHQELMPFPALTVAENIFMGNEPTVGFPGWLNKKKMNTDAALLLGRLGTKINVTAKMNQLSIAEMQMVEIAKALSNDAEVIFMDEPTSAISSRETESLFQLIGELKRQGIAIVYISHKMDEILRIADTVTVMRDGKYIDTREAAGINNSQLISLIVGRDIDKVFDKKHTKPGGILLETKGLTGERFTGIDLTVRSGEVLGIAGLMGSGRTEIVNAIYGLGKYSAGDIFINGCRVIIRSPQDAIRNRIGMVTEDRKKFGLVLKSSVKHNLTLSALKRFSGRLFLHFRKESSIAAKKIAELNIKTSSPDQVCGLLSGGNQQKIVIGKMLLNEVDIIILDEPTRGIDIGAKVEIYRLMSELADQGKAIIMVSSELPEILGMSDRIIVVRDGRIKAELTRADATQEVIMHYAMA